MIISIFNDVIGPVMRGPSSSHCAAALRIGRLARDLMRGDLEEVVVSFDRGGALATTHDSQGSDMGLFGGLLGWEADDERLPVSPRALREASINSRIEIGEFNDPHPNTYRLALCNGQQSHTLQAVSTGGGMIRVINIDGYSLEIDGDYFETLIWTRGDGPSVVQAIQSRLDTDDIRVLSSDAGHLIQVKSQSPMDEDVVAAVRVIDVECRIERLAPVLPVMSHKGLAVPFTCCEEMQTHYGNEVPPLWQVAVDYESARSGLSAEDVLVRMEQIVKILRRSVLQGIEGTHYEDRILGHQSGRFLEKMESGKLLPGGVLNRVVLYVTALMEVKSSMGVIVAAPTAGACAALPGACLALANELDLSDRTTAQGLLAAGVIGMFIAARSTFAAEVGGCQAECGSAAAMAAAALVTMTNGPARQAVAAASMALQSSLGLICDPVGNRVEVPCLGKNILAAGNALSCANMALADYDPVISLDEVIETADRVGRSLPRELRCTALGGLATTRTSLEIEKKLVALKKNGCGTSCGCR